MANEPQADTAELLDVLIEAALGYGVFDDDDSPLWARCAAWSRRDPETGLRLPNA